MNFSHLNACHLRVPHFVSCLLFWRRISLCTFSDPTCSQHKYILVSGFLECDISGRAFSIDLQNCCSLKSDSNGREEIAPTGLHAHSLFRFNATGNPRKDWKQARELLSCKKGDFTRRCNSSQGVVDCRRPSSTSAARGLPEALHFLAIQPRSLNLGGAPLTMKHLSSEQSISQSYQSTLSTKRQGFHE